MVNYEALKSLVLQKMINYNCKYPHKSHKDFRLGNQQYISIRINIVLLIVFTLIIPNLVKSAPISKTLPNNIIANADYRVGDNKKPAILVLHGFMSTYNLNIVQTIVDELAGDGYTVLAPTLSLNINNRHSGANCEAAHTHTMESDVDEIRWWINWLANKHKNNVIVIGHSTGSLQLAMLLAINPPKQIVKAILTSPTYMQGEPYPKSLEDTDIMTAKTQLKAGDNSLHQYHLSYCNGNFTAPPNAYLSYKKWSRAHLLRTLSTMSIPSVIIIGDQDTRYGPHWATHLQTTHIPVMIIPGANHFFDSPYEFDFLDLLKKHIK